MWTGVSILMLLAGICALVWWYAAQAEEDERGRCRKEIRSAVGAQRLRSWQRSNTSGSWRR